MLDKTIAELEKIFDKLNEALFSDKLLPKPIIVVQSTAKKKAYGFCTVHKIWKEGDGDNAHDNYEITIGAEFLNRPIAEVVGTVLHEMCHLFDLVAGVKDCNGKVHSKKFRTAAEDHGLICEKEDKIGWGRTKLNDDVKELIKTFDIDENAFKWHRLVEPPKVVEKKPSYRYICPACGMKLTGKSNGKVLCMDCNVEMECEEV